MEQAPTQKSTAKPAGSFEKKLRYTLRGIVRDRYLYLILLPCFVFYIVFIYRPMWGLQIAFKDYSPYLGLQKSPWIGFENFANFFNGPYFSRTVINTLMLNIYGLVFAFPAPIILALLMNEIKNRMLKKTIQTIVYLPYFVSVVVVAGIVINFLAPTQGIINVIIEKLGGTKEYFMVKPEYFRGIYTAMHIWKDTGFNSIIYIAALSGIDIQLYEACIIDGGNRWKQFLHITLPGIMPTVIIMLILKLGSMLDVGYESIILLYQPATYATADTISTYVFRVGVLENKYGFAAAVGLFNAVVALVLVFISNKISKRLTDTGLW